MSEEYPVIVTVETKHVVWIEADSLEDAAKRASYDTYELISDTETAAEFSMSVDVPTEWDWDTIEDGGYNMPYRGVEPIAHVKAHQEHLRQVARDECAAAGHPDAVPHKWIKDTLHCPVCFFINAPSAVAA